MPTALSRPHRIYRTLKHTETGPRVCIADRKPPIRKALGKILEEFGSTVCECENVSRLTAAIHTNDPEVVFVGVSSGAFEAVEMLGSMAANQFKKRVVLFGPNEELRKKEIQRIGTKLGLKMLPLLEAPIDNESLLKCVAAPLSNREPSISVGVAEAVNAGWVELWYQPIFDVQTLQMAGVEGLARVRHPIWGILSPASLPAKGDPYFRVFSDFVITQAVDDWNDVFREYNGLNIAINLPMDYFEEPQSVALLNQSLLDNPGLAKLIVEIDACDLIRDINVAKSIAGWLRKCKISTSIDDTAGEWRALASISDFPFAEIKVDRKLIAGCAHDRLKRSACREIIDFAHKFGVRTVAEGVERRSEFFAACELGFDLVQGFLFGKPMSVPEFATNMSQNSPLVPML